MFDGHPPSTADLNVLDMGTTGDLDAFGFFLNPARVPFQAANGGAVPFQLRMEAADVAITRNGATVTSGDGILSLLMGPPGEELLPSPAHAIVIETGDPPVALEAGFKLLQSPTDLGLASGDRITFTALFKAEALVPIPPPTPTPEPTQRPTPTPEPGTFIVPFGGVVPMSATASPSDWDPHVVVRITDIQAISPMYNQLVEYNPINPGQIIGDLASSWEVSADGLAWTFNLRQGVKWWDGQPLTADDVVFSINRMIAIGQPSPWVGKLRDYISQVELIDSNTVRVHTLFPSEAFLKFLAMDPMKVLPKHVVEAGVDINLFENVTGSGPFKSVSFTDGLTYEFTKNLDYFKAPLPFFDGIRAFVITDKGTEIAAFRTERILMCISTVNLLTL